MDSKLLQTFGFQGSGGDYYLGLTKAQWLGYRPYPDNHGTVYEWVYNKLQEPIIMKDKLEGMVKSYFPNTYPEDGILDGKYYIKKTIS